MSIRLRWFAVGLLAGVLAFVPVGKAQQSSTDAGVKGTAQSATTSLSGVVVDNTGGVLPGAVVVVKNVATGVSQQAVTNSNGRYSFPSLDVGTYTVTISMQGFKKAEYSGDGAIRLLAGIPAELKTTLQIGGSTETVQVKGTTDLVRTQSPTVSTTVSTEFISSLPRSDRNALSFLVFLPGDPNAAGPQKNTNITSINGVYQGAPTSETYASIATNPFMLTSDQPLSTFAADVDTASYTNVRRFLSQGRLPPADAVRVEELINYFRFSYPDPKDQRPVSITTEIGDCPWAAGHKLALVGLRAKPIDDRNVGGRNITLLLDVSGSMAPPERLPLIKTAMRMFVDTLRDDDQIAIVTYAGTTGVALPATSGSHRQRIHEAILDLQAGGSTNGAAGITLAYQTARENFVPGGINRVILATDGDFNVGVTSRDDLIQLIQKERASGVFLSVLGVGSGNLKDATMEMLADKGNGHYAYLDSLQEARRVLVREGGATLETVAKDVKLQVEFNPAQVAAYKLIGYEKRLLAARDFNDDRKDGGEMGAGHTVTALYEIVPTGAELPRDLVPPGGRPAVDPLKYQTDRQTVATRSTDWLTVKVRYKQPDAMTSEVMEQALRPGGTATHLSFAAAVAEFGMLLRDDRPLTERWDGLAKRLKGLTGVGSAADREAFGELVETAASLKKLGKY